MDKRYLLKRLVMMVLSIFSVITILFFLFRQIPGGPTALMAPGGLPEAQRQQVLKEFGLTKPLWEQYLIFMQQLIFEQDLGQSFYYSRPVTEVIADRLELTLALMLPSFVLAYTVGAYVGAHLAWIRGARMERLEMVLVLLVRSTPVFWTGLVLLYVFSFELGWFPVGGAYGLGSTPESRIDLFLSWEFLRHLALPMISLSLFYAGLPVLLMRNNMLDVLTEGYIQTARAKGLSDRRIMLWHAARNASLPVVTAFAVVLGYSVGGAVLIETVFSWPGMGRLLVNSVLQRDYPIVQGLVLVYAVIVILSNLFVDIMYSYFDPRIEYE